MNRRLIRLYNDYKEIREKLGEHPYIEIRDVFGDPPERYLIYYKVKGMVQQGEKIVVKEGHTCEIILSGEYPRLEPICRMTSQAVFHPNIAPNKICIADHWAAGESLADVITRIGEMISFQNYNIKSPLNGEAAKWAEENIHRFPVDDCNLEPTGISTFETGEIPLYQDLLPSKEGEKAAFSASKQVYQCENCGSGGFSARIEGCAGGHWVCPDCMISCAQCGLKMCVLCSFTKCEGCGRLLCPQCESSCTVCGKGNGNST